MSISLSVTEPGILFPGISLLFLAFTNRYLALANVIRSLNQHIDEQFDENRELQIQNLFFRIKLIKYMQACGAIAFLFCIASMFCLMLELQTVGVALFVMSLSSLFISLVLCFTEIMHSGTTLRIELERTHPRAN
jgi:energy-converting hydrogenase Eha subunit E